MRGGRIICIALTAVLGLPAFAGENATAQAREHCDRAERHYRLGEFDQAAVEYKEAYRLHPAAALLFNLGQSYRQAGKHKDAVFHLGQYLSQVPDAPNRPLVEALVAEERRAAEADEAPVVPPNPIVVVEERTREVRVPVTVLVEKSWRPARIASVAAGGAGVVALGVGMAEGLRSRNLSNDLQSRVQQNGGVYRQQDLGTLESGRSATRAANTLFVVSAALIAVGAGLWFAF